MNSSQIDFVLVANSPGELSALVKPIAAELGRQQLGRVTLVLTPCQYNSGKELEFAKELKGLDRIITAAEYKRWALTGKSPLPFNSRGVVLFLGGDLLHAIIIAKKLRFPAYAYLNEIIGWKKAYKKFFVADQLGFRKFAPQLPPEKLIESGNLMVDAVADLPSWQPEPGVITFMPGSRRWEIAYMTPFYRQVKHLVEKELSGIRCQVVSSPFVEAEPLDGARVISFAELHNSELVVTIPGTNTAKVAARGIPMLVVFPLNNAELIPMDGLANLIGRLPLIGKFIKRGTAALINKKTRFFALPNQKAEREIVPEIRGNITPQEVARKVIDLYKDRAGREKMSQELLQALGKPGAAKKIVEELINGL